MIIADRIKELRKRNNFTQKELAQKLQVKSSTVSGWELGRNEPNVDTIKKLAKIFNVPFDYVAGVSQSSDIKPTEVDLDDPVVLSYGGKPVSREDMDIIKAILKRHHIKKRD